MTESERDRYEYIIDRVAKAMAKQDQAEYEGWRRDTYRKLAEVAIDTIRAAGWML